MSDHPDFEELGIGSQYGTTFQRLLDAIHKVEAKVDALDKKLTPPVRPTCGNLYNLETEPR